MTMFNVACSPAEFGINGSVFLGFALLAVLGLRSPLKFAPVLCAELAYKSIWLLGVALPLGITGRFPASELPTVVIFVVFVIAELIGIPFHYILARQPEFAAGAQPATN
jgi:hypothetical protein